MPSPIGHALGGVAIGLLATSSPRSRMIVACAVAAALPDVDFLLPMRHRGLSHSIGAAVLAGAVAFAWLKFSNSRGAARWAVVIAVAYGTHVLFDWLGADTSAPRGLMALWPFSSSFYISDLGVFDSVDRRYWLKGFWRRNILAVTREVAILAPLVGIAWWWRHSTSSRDVH
jgi:inner membrane protein